MTSGRFKLQSNLVAAFCRALLMQVWLLIQAIAKYCFKRFRRCSSATDRRPCFTVK